MAPRDQPFRLITKESDMNQRFKCLCVFLFMLVTFVVTSVSAQPAGAGVASYPNRPIKIVVATGAGGITDLLARFVGQKISENLGQPVVIENRPGAGGTIGSSAVAKSVPDGYTLLWIFPSHTVNPSLFKSLPYDTVKDFAPVIKVTNVELVLIANQAVPANSVQELIVLAKRDPQKMNYGAVGDGSVGHLGALLFTETAGVSFVHVPYKGAPQVLAALLANDIQIFFDVPITAIPQIQAGRVKALAVTGKQRALVLPEVPTMVQAGLAGFEVAGFNGILAPAGTPTPVIQKLNQEVGRILKQPEVKQWFESKALEPLGGSPELFAQDIQSDIAKWAKILSAAGIQSQ